jgi:hypothetical protein
MLTRINRVWLIAVVTALVVAGTILGSAAAQKAAVPRPQDRLALGEDRVRQLLLLMEADKEGRVSNPENS